MGRSGCGSHRQPESACESGGRPLEEGTPHVPAAPVGRAQQLCQAQQASARTPPDCRKRRVKEIVVARREEKMHVARIFIVNRVAIITQVPVPV